MEPEERGCVNKEMARMVIEDKNRQDLKLLIWRETLATWAHGTCLYLRAWESGAPVVHVPDQTGSQDMMKVVAQKQAEETKIFLYLLSYSVLHWIGWGLPISRGGICFTSSIDSNASLIQKQRHRHRIIWVPSTEIKLAHTDIYHGRT